MNNEVQTAINDIREETEDILTEEPKDVERMRKGLIVSGAGSDSQYLAPLLFAQSEVRGMIIYSTTGLIEFARDDIAVCHLKKLSKILLERRAGFVRFCGLFDFYDIFQVYFNTLEYVETRLEYVELTQAIHMYGTKIHDWLEFAFPWEFGNLLPHVSSEDIDRQLNLMIEYQEAYFDA